jgi:hypothetical protein
MRGKKTPDTRRAEAVGLALVQGVPAASKALGIPQRTIRDWKDDPEFAELRLSAREDVGAAMWVAIQIGLGEVYGGLRNPDEPLKAKSDTVAMLIEKRALLMGEATERTESLTSGFDPAQQQRIREWLASLAGGEADSGRAGDAVALPSEAAAAPTER